MTSNPRITMALVLVTLGCVADEIDHGMSEEEATFPARLAGAYCETLFACDPVNTCWVTPAIPYASEAECIEVERTALEEAQEAAREGGLEYDDECVERHIAVFAEVGCDGETRVDVRLGESYSGANCQPYHGTIPAGEDPCFDVIGTELSDCERGALCDVDNNTCDAFEETRCECQDGYTCPYATASDACQPIIALGEPCILDDGTLLGVCEVDSRCDYGFAEGGVVTGSSTCVPMGAIGSPCEHGGYCASWECRESTCVPASPWLCEDYRAPRRWR